MTAPATSIATEQGRKYTHPHRPDELYDSVTNAISKGIPKNLDNWFKRVTAEYCVDNLALLGTLEREAAVDLAKRECDRIRDAAGDRGTVTHTLVEAAGKLEVGTYASFEDFKAAALGHAGDVWVSGIEGYVDAGLRFLWDWRPTIHAAEVTVYSHRHRYAGTADLFATLPGLGDGILDWKTSSDIYPETGLQLAAYRFADEALLDGNPVAVPDVGFGGAIHLKADGTYNVVVLRCGVDEHHLFLGALRTARWVMEQAREVRLGEYTAPPPDAPWWASPARRDWLVGRVARIRDEYPALLPQLAANWPAGVPTFRQADRHTPAQLEAIRAAVAVVEAQAEIPFGEGDPLPQRGGVPLAPAEECTAVERRLAALPADLRDVVEAAMHKAEMPRLHSGRVTAEDLAAIEQVLTPAEVEAAQRHHAVLELLGDFARDRELVDLIAAYATGGGHADLARLSEDEIGRARLVIAGLHSGALVLGYDDELGQPLFTVPQTVELRLVNGLGSKSALLAAGREAAKALGLPTPRGSAQVVAEPLIVAQLVEHLAGRAA